VGVVPEGGNPDVQDEDKSLDTARELSGLGKRIVVEDVNELPSRIPNSALNDAHSSSGRTLGASRSSSPSGLMHLRHDMTAIFRHCPSTSVSAAHRTPSL